MGRLPDYLRIQTDGKAPPADMSFVFMPTIISRHHQNHTVICLVVFLGRIRDAQCCRITGSFMLPVR